MRSIDRAAQLALAGRPAEPPACKREAEENGRRLKRYLLARQDPWDMPIVDANRLKGNYAAAHVAAMFSTDCLVRPVAADTDVGIDLYCETVEKRQPFLHFWVQVRSGKQCRRSRDGQSYSSSFRRDHLEYWLRQPVPVFAALVPVAWPVKAPPAVHVVCITSQLVCGRSLRGKTHSMKSDCVLAPGCRDDVLAFLAREVKVATAQVDCRKGLISSLPQLSHQYERSATGIPVARYKHNIRDQIRSTAALAVLMLYSSGDFGPDTHGFRKRMAQVLCQFTGDHHWENYMARGLSHHVDGEFASAQECYANAIASIGRDRKVRAKPKWRARVRWIRGLEDAARREAPLPEPQAGGPRGAP